MRRLGVALVFLPYILSLGYVMFRGWWMAALSLGFVTFAMASIVGGIFLLIRSEP